MSSLFEFSSRLRNTNADGLKYFHGFVDFFSFAPLIFYPFSSRYGLQNTRAFKMFIQNDLILIRDKYPCTEISQKAFPKVFSCICRLHIKQFRTEIVHYSQHFSTNPARRTNFYVDAVNEILVARSTCRGIQMTE